MDIKSIAKYWV